VREIHMQIVLWPIKLGSALLNAISGETATFSMVLQAGGITITSAGLSKA